MLNLVQHLMKPKTCETLKQVQGDNSGLLTNLSNLGFKIFSICNLRSAICNVVIHPSSTNHRGCLVHGEEGDTHPVCDGHRLPLGC